MPDEPDVEYAVPELTLKAFVYGMDTVDQRGTAPRDYFKVSYPATGDL